MDVNEIKGHRTGKILQFSVPAIIAMVLTAFVTVADGFFMGRYVGEAGIAAVNLGLPVVYLYLGVGLMISIGGVAMAGMALGAGEKEEANRVFRQTMVTAGACSVFISWVMVFSFQPMLGVLGVRGQVKGYFEEYYRIMLLEFPVMVVNSAFGMFIRGDGKPEFFMKVTVVNVLLNVVLDYGFAGVLGLGSAGIALASLVSALAALGCILWFFGRRAESYRLGRFRFSWQVFARGMANGSSEFIGEMSTGIAMFAYNFVIMRRFGVDGVTAFTVVGYVSFVFSMVVVGFGQGSSPLISFCYGAGERDLAADLRRRTNGFVLGAGVLVFLVMTGLSGWYGSLFARSEEVRGMIREGMVIFMVSFFFCGVNSITSFYFTATGRAFQSAVISFSRGLVVLLACIFALPAVFGMTGVWLAAPVTEAVTLGITGRFLWEERRRKKG